MVRLAKPPIDRTVTVVAAAIFASHMAVSWRHGFFRDELYFIACGRHPAFGYVDQPPLIPLLAAATQIFGHCLVFLRTIPALAHAATAIVTARLASRVARDVGLDGRFAGGAAAAALGLAPMMLGIHTTLETTTAIRLNGKIEQWKDDCAEAVIAGQFGAGAFVMPYEHDRPIFVCRGLKRGLAREWGEFKHYD